MIRVTQIETVYRVARFSRSEAIQILTEEVSEPLPVQELNAMYDQDLANHLVWEEEVLEYLESEVVENDSGIEWESEAV